MQKIIIIALFCAAAFAATPAAPVAFCAGTVDGSYITAGVCQKCDVSCKTCTGPLASDCVTCWESVFTVAAGVCGCHTSGEVPFATAGIAPAKAAITCAAIGALDAAKCQLAGMWFKTVVGCQYCAPLCQECSDATTCIVDVTGDATTRAIKGCWGTLTGSATCTYTAAKSSIGTDLVVDNTTQTDPVVSAVKGFFYEATGFKMTACGKGCESCTSATAGCKCATGFMETTAKNACECPAIGYLAVVSGAATLGSCTACAAGCKTCTAAAVCTVCLDSSWALGSTTDSSSTCESVAASSDTTTTSTTDGETDGESTSTAATDATASSGVLITAASMLLAVILA